MTEASHQPVFDAVAALRDTLRAVPTPDAERALYHVERLEQAVRHWHAEAIRFAAYTINHVINGHEAQLGDQRELLRQRIEDLRRALADAGHTF
jgi:hypothetical protein